MYQILRVPKVLFWLSLIVDVAALSPDDGLQALPEGLAPVADVLLHHGIPVLVDRGLEGVDVGVADRAGLGLHMHPEGEVKRVGIRTVGRPHLLGPERDVLRQPLLSLLGGFLPEPSFLPTVLDLLTAYTVFLATPNCLEISVTVRPALKSARIEIRWSRSKDIFSARSKVIGAKFGVFVDKTYRFQQKLELVFYSHATPRNYVKCECSDFTGTPGNWRFF